MIGLLASTSRYHNNNDSFPRMNHSKCLGKKESLDQKDKPTSSTNQGELLASLVSEFSPFAKDALALIGNEAFEKIGPWPPCKGHDYEAVHRRRESYTTTHFCLPLSLFFRRLSEAPRTPCPFAHSQVCSARKFQ